MSATAAPGAGVPDPGGYPVHAPAGFTVALKAALAGMKDHDVSSLAAAVAFRIFLSLFPAAVAAVAIFSLLGDPATLLGRVNGLVPPAVADLLEERVLGVADTQGAGLLAVAGVLGGIWAASSAATTLMSALNRINGTTEERGRRSRASWPRRPCPSAARRSRRCGPNRLRRGSPAPRRLPARR